MVKEKIYVDKLKYEKDFIAKGCTLIAGVDEVGRGPLAGPVVCCSVIMPLDEDKIIEGVDDSKKISEKKRIALAEKIKEMPTVDAFAKGVLSKLIAQIYKRYQTTETSVMLDKLKDLGFKYSTLSGITMSAFDIVVSEKKEKILEEGKKKVETIGEYAFRLNYKLSQINFPDGLEIIDWYISKLDIASVRTMIADSLTQFIGSKLFDEEGTTEGIPETPAAPPVNKEKEKKMGGPKARAAGRPKKNSKK